METNEKLSDLSLSDLCSLHQYIFEENGVYENCNDSEETIVKNRLELIAIEQEIEKRRGDLFIH